MSNEEKSINGFGEEAINKYPSGVRKTEYQKIVEGATAEQKDLAEKLLREQSVQAKVDRCYRK